MTKTTVIQNIQETCDGLGMVDLAGIKLETANKDLLDVTKFTIDQHVAMQPAAIAYFGSMKSMAQRILEGLKFDFELWEVRKKFEARIVMEKTNGGPKGIRMGDIEAQYVVDNEPEIRSRREVISVAQKQSDDLTAFYEAFKQKSFSIREYAGIEEDERFNNNTSMENPQNRKESEKVNKIREMMRARQLKSVE